MVHSSPNNTKTRVRQSQVYVAYIQPIWVVLNQKGENDLVIK